MEAIDFSLIPIGWLVLLGIALILMVCIVVLMFFFIFPMLTPKWMLPKGIDEKPSEEYVSEYHTNYGGGYSSSETKKEDTSSWDNNNINLMQNF